MSNQVNVTELLSAFGESDPSSASGDTPKLPAPAESLVRIKELKFRPSQRDTNTYFIVEFELVQGNHPDGVVGTLYGWAHNINNKWYGMSNTKQFIAAALGLDPASLDAKSLQLAHVYQVLGMAGPQDTIKPGPQQPLTERVVWVRTTPGESSNGKYTKHKWAPYCLDAQGAALPPNFG